nr:hypothetical protein [Nakamurella lactea]
MTYTYDSSRYRSVFDTNFTFLGGFWRNVDRFADQLALVDTADPKGVSLPAAAEVLTAHDVIMHFPMDPADRTLNMTPWFHRGGISPGDPNQVF